jgi:hypothetical protein
MNYRGIAIFTTVGKLIELMVYIYLYEDLKGQLQLVDCQHGFVKGRSIVKNLLEYSCFVLKSIEDGCQVDSIYTDFSKAFDSLIKCVIVCSWIKCRAIPLSVVGFLLFW